MEAETATGGGELHPTAAVSQSVSQPVHWVSPSVGVVVNGGPDRWCPNIFISLHWLIDADQPKQTKDLTQDDFIIKHIFNHPF